MLLGDTSGQVRVSGSDGIQQLLVFATQQFQIIRLAEQPLQAPVQGLQDVAEQFVAGQTRNLIMEFSIRLSGRVHILPTRGIRCLLQQPFQGQQFRLRNAPGREPAAHAFKGFAHVKEFLHICACELADHQTSGGPFSDQAFLAKHAEGFSYG